MLIVTIPKCPISHSQSHLKMLYFDHLMTDVPNNVANESLPPVFFFANFMLQFPLILCVIKPHNYFVLFLFKKKILNISSLTFHSPYFGYFFLDQDWSYFVTSLNILLCNSSTVYFDHFSVPWCQLRTISRGCFRNLFLLTGVYDLFFFMGTSWHCNHCMFVKIQTFCHLAIYLLKGMYSYMEKGTETNQIAFKRAFYHSNHFCIPVSGSRSQSV